MQPEQVGVRLMGNFSGMNESCDSRSSIRIAPVRSIPSHTKGKLRHRIGCILLLLPTAPPLRISRTVFDCAERCHTRLDSCL